MEVRVVDQMHRVTDCLYLHLVWRIVVGLSLIPAFGTLYQRLTLPESTRYEKSRNVELTEQGESKKDKNMVESGVHTAESEESADENPSVPAVKKAHFRGTVAYCVEFVPWFDRCFRGYSVLL